MVGERVATLIHHRKGSSTLLVVEEKEVEVLTFAEEEALTLTLLAAKKEEEEYSTSTLHQLLRTLRDSSLDELLVSMELDVLRPAWATQSSTLRESSESSSPVLEAS